MLRGRFAMFSASLFVRDSFEMRSGYVQFLPILMRIWSVFAFSASFLHVLCRLFSIENLYGAR
jgi:hypothetical protein